MKPLSLKIPADRVDDGVADLADGPLSLRAQPQVAVLHQEVDAVGLGRDRVALGRGDDLAAGDGQLVAADAPLVGPDGAGHATATTPARAA